jgi:regulator of protease activity HflC (stomatin/prohibitin superfamily)
MFHNAYPLNGSSVTRSGNSSGATVESGESSFSTSDNGSITARKTVWFRWSPPSDAIYYVATKGSGYDTVLGIFTGTSVSSVSRVTANDDANGTAQSLVRFVARSNTTYYISIGAFGSSPGGA